MIGRGHCILSVDHALAEGFSKLDIKAIIRLLHGPPTTRVTLTMRDPAKPQTPYVVALQRRLVLPPPPGAERERRQRDRESEGGREGERHREREREEGRETYRQTDRQTDRVLPPPLWTAPNTLCT